MYIFGKKIDFPKKCPKTFPKPILSCLDCNYRTLQPTWKFEAMLIFGPKWHFLANFAKNLGHTYDHKNRLWGRKNIPRPVLESWDAIFSISNLILQIWVFLQLERYTLILVAQTQHFWYYTVLVTKRHQNREICWCNFDFGKVWTFTFPKHVSECVYDLWLWFYGRLKVCENLEKKGWGDC